MRPKEGGEREVVKVTQVAGERRKQNRHKSSGGRSIRWVVKRMLKGGAFRASLGKDIGFLSKALLGQSLAAVRAGATDKGAGCLRCPPLLSCLVPAPQRLLLILFLRSDIRIFSTNNSTTKTPSAKAWTIKGPTSPWLHSCIITNSKPLCLAARLANPPAFALLQHFLVVFVFIC